MGKKVAKKTEDLHVRIEPDLKKAFEERLRAAGQNKTDVIIGFIKAFLGIV